MNEIPDIYWQGWTFSLLFTAIVLAVILFARRWPLKRKRKIPYMALPKRLIPHSDGTLHVEKD